MLPLAIFLKPSIRIPNTARSVVIIPVTPFGGMIIRILEAIIFIIDRG